MSKHFTNAQPYILFLIEEDGYYYICGAYQGRFIVKNGYAFQQATVDAHLKNYQPQTSQSFAQTIQNLVSSPQR